MAIWTGFWYDDYGRPFDENSSGPGFCDAHNPAHVIRRATNRSPGQKQLPFCQSILARRRWEPLSEFDKSLYDFPTSYYAIDDRYGAQLTTGRYSFFTHANITTVMRGDHYWVGMTHDKDVPVGNFEFYDHIPAQRIVTFAYEIALGHPEGFDTYTAIHIAQIRPTKTGACRPPFWTKVFYTKHWKGHIGPNFYEPVIVNLSYPFRLRSEQPLQLYMRIRAPDYLPGQWTVDPIPITIP